MTKYNKHLILFLLIANLFSTSCKFSVNSAKQAQATDFFLGKTESSFFFNDQEFSNDQLEDSFPAVSKRLNLNNLKINRENYSVTAFYGNHKYKIKVTDDLQNKFKNVNGFTERYKIVGSTDSDKTQVATVRDGYKTITKIEKDSISLSFIFKKRYFFEITSYQDNTPYQVWRFLELSNFRQLPE